MIVDDHAILRDGLRELLERSGRFEVVGHAADGADAVKVAQTLRPDVIIMDVLMPVMNGIDACREIMELLPGTHVLVLTASTQEDAVIDSVAAGATGFLQKLCDKDELLDALQNLADGQYHFPSSELRKVFAGLRHGTGRPNPTELARLTERELHTLKLFAVGTSNAEIARARGVHPVTIRNTLYGIQEKLAIKSKQELVVWAVRNGLLDDQE